VGFNTLHAIKYRNLADHQVVDSWKASRLNFTKKPADWQRPFGMALFQIKRPRVARISPEDKRIKEDVIHKLIESNLSVFFDDLILVARKPYVGGRYFDTLALNTATKVPVIIEYKREKERHVVEQVDLYYAKLRLNQHQLMLLISKQDIVEDLAEVDYENPQIIVVAKEFTQEQREILALSKERLRLFQYQLYANQIMSLEEVEPLGSPGGIPPASRISRPASSGPYTLEHFGMRPETRKFYEKLDSGIRKLDSRVKPAKVNKYFIGYASTGSYFCVVQPRVKKIRIQVKYHTKPPHIRGLSLQRIPAQFHSPMTHAFDLSSESQLPLAVRAIRGALEASL
jgi:hypothetical protein